MHLPRFIVDRIDPAEIRAPENGAPEISLTEADSWAVKSRPNFPFEILLPEDESHHLSKVLRCDIGDFTAIYDRSRGTWFSGKVSRIEPAGAFVECVGVIPFQKAPRVHLLVGLVSLEKCELIAEKVTELGISSIGFFSASRSQIRLQAPQQEKKLERLQRICIAALKQSGAERLPKVRFFSGLEVALETLAEIKPADTISLRLILLAPQHFGPTDEASSPVPALRTAQAKQVPDITEIIRANTSLLENLHADVDFYMLIGPEGGFTAEEIVSATNSGFQATSLGTNTLRTETAAIAAAAIVSSLSRA